ncbi:peptidoglycan editing factor PgeF [Nocardioides seonyuensis]|uniref:peptidoglycan editing factor PgeF n=1 Tax=Nocardioides seonyuensis TaxID=2518371 RepID=UPI001FC9D458|nr:peptidoglycan editing factor PgeF [Nocardioides seonyuensis]
MFVLRDSLEAASTPSRVDVAFTDSSLDLQGRRPGFATALSHLESDLGIRFARLDQVHGNDVLVVEDEPTYGPLDEVPTADAQVTTLRRVGLMVRVADCVPVLLADPENGVVGVAHAGRQGVALDVVTRTVDRMRELGATSLTAWIGPHVCGRCYEVPEQMRADVSALVPETRATSAHGTPALDLGAGVRAQLDRAGVEVRDVGLCTLEDDRLHSHRRDGTASGRMAGLVWMS